MQKINTGGERNRTIKKINPSTKLRIKKELGNQKSLIQCAEKFNVIGDLTRLKVCYLFCHYEGLSVGDIADTIGVSISAVSHTLKKLQEAGVVESHRVHRNVYYRLKKSPFTNIIKDQFSAKGGSAFGGK